MWCNDKYTSLSRGGLDPCVRETPDGDRMAPKEGFNQKGPEKAPEMFPIFTRQNQEGHLQLEKIQLGPESKACLHVTLARD